MSKVIELRGKVRGITQINKTAEAMQVIAVTRLKEIQSRQRAVHHFKKHYSRLAKRLKIDDRPAPKNVKPVDIIYVLTSQRGFCGGFNENLIAQFHGFLKQQKGSGREVRAVVFGKKGYEICRERGVPDIVKQVLDTDKDDFERITQDIAETYQLYTTGQVQKVYVFYNEFFSILTQKPRMLQLFPFDLSEISVPAEDIIFDLPMQTVKEHVALQYSRVIFYDAFMQTRLGAVGSRLMTMRNASESSKDMLNALNLKLNKARQSMITIELSEILSSFEILAGEEG